MGRREGQVEGLELMGGRDRGAFWAGRKVLITGHTGFIGGWLAHALAALGAKVTGYSDAVPTDPSLFERSKLGELINDQRGDIADVATLTRVVEATKPEIVFHLAAQPLVRRAFRQPFETYRANVMGTVALLEALRSVASAKTAVMMTTDKVYYNKEWIWPYRETDQLGGHEPYGLSKAMAEMVIAQYAEGYFANEPAAGKVATRLISVRAGNVIGGGDWSEDRLVPDAMRAWDQGQELKIRSPKSTRPWQHVLEVADALMLLAERAGTDAKSMKPNYNIGPDPGSELPVGQICELLSAAWGKGAVVKIEVPQWQAPESQALAVDSTLFRTNIGWKPALALPDGIRWTVEWYKNVMANPSRARTVTHDQIQRYFDGNL